MGTDADSKLSDEALDRLARRLFAEVRAEHPEDEPDARARSGGDPAAEAAVESLDQLLGDDGGDGDA